MIPYPRIVLDLVVMLIKNARKPSIVMYVDVMTLVCHVEVA